MIIGITGTDGAGKGTVVNYLVQTKGFVHYHVRSLLLEEIRTRGLPSDRTHMRLVGNELRKKHGNAFIVEHFLKQANTEGVQYAVIDSLRARAEAECLKAHGGILLAVDADQQLRYERVQKRRSESDQVTFEQFQEHEALEMEDLDPHGMQKQKVVEMADYVIVNDGTVEELHAKVEDVLSHIE